MADTFDDGIEYAAQIADNWGDQCAGGDGQAIVPSGPNKGQKYGQAWYNFAQTLRKFKKKEVVMKGKQQVVVIEYMSGMRDVLQLDPEFSPVMFADDKGILNVLGRFRTAGNFEWHYFPLSNIKHYTKHDGEIA